VTHLLLIGSGLLSHSSQAINVMSGIKLNLGQDFMSFGFWGVMAIFMRAFSIGGGTYTGIEAVSNGLQVMREPRIQTGKRTMVYLAVSLAFTAGGLLTFSGSALRKEGP
jgi:hypothetical protein